MTIHCAQLKAQTCRSNDRSEVVVQAFPVERSHTDLAAPQHGERCDWQHVQAPVRAEVFTEMPFHNLCWHLSDVQRQVP